MSVASVANTGTDLRGIAEALAPGGIRFDPFGLVSGYRTYLIYSGLAAKSDDELSRLGVARADLPRIAVRAAAIQRAA